MRSAVLRIVVPAMVCLVAAGCGGSSGSKGSGGGGGGGGGGPTTVTFKFTGGTPTAVATQIGAGSFTSVTPSSSVTLSIPSGTNGFAVAYVCQEVLGTEENGTQITATWQMVIEASTLDGTTFSDACQGGSIGSTGTLTGDLDASAIPAVNDVGVAASNGSSSQEDLLSGNTAAAFSAQAPAGTDRVAVAGYIYTSGENGSDSVWTLAAARNFDGVNVPGAVNGGNAVTLGAADEVTEEPITYKNVQSGFSAPGTLATYVWSNGGGILLSNQATTQYPAVAAGAAESGDYYSFDSSAFGQTSSNIGQSVFVDTNTPTSGPLTVSFPAPWSYAGPTASAQPVFDMANSGITGTTGLVETGELEWVENENQFYWIVSATGNYLSGSNTVTFPNLSGLAGFVAAPSGSQAYWGAEVSLSTMPSIEPLGANGGATGVGTSGGFTVP